MTVRLIHEPASDRGGAIWTAEAVDGNLPYAEYSGVTPIDAVTGLAGILAGMVNAQRQRDGAARAEHVDELRALAEADLTPEQRAALAASKARLAERRAAAAQEDWG